MSYELILGDCRDILPTLTGIDAVITDPPYGMNCDTDNTRFTMGPNGHGKASSQKHKPVIGDDAPFDPSPWLEFDKVVLWGANHFAARLPVGTTLVWIKRFDAAFGSFLSDAEIAWMKGGHGVYCKRDTSLLGETRNRLHATQKPVSLMKWCLDMAKIPMGATILDPFAGSGTTIVAAIKTGRNAIGVEIDPHYFSVAQRRCEDAAAQPSLFAVEEIA